MIHGLPKVFITPDDHKQLQNIVRYAYDKRWSTAQFLNAEVRRAEIRDPLPKHVVKPGTLVRYQLDWGPFTPARELVYPNYFASDATQISLLSEIGVALLGLRRGDTMGVALPDVGFRTVHVATVVDPNADLAKYSSCH